MKLRRKKIRTYLALSLLILPLFVFKLNKHYKNGFYNPITKLVRFYNPREARTDEIYYKPHYVVGIYGDLKIVKYLWFDVLGARNVNICNEENVAFRIITEYENFSEYNVLLLVGNGRSEENISKLKFLLDYLSSNSDDKEVPPNMKKLKALSSHTTVGLLMIGHELCRNEWLEEYLKVEGGRLSFVFTTYNAFEIHEYPKLVHHWPLGVASYRRFPPLSTISIDLEFRRPFFCNFMGTVYQHSSRSNLVKELADQPPDNNSICYLLIRDQWRQDESSNSSTLYQFVLKSSDFTLCPVGLNEETYRIYEALSMASVPIIEDHSPIFRSPEHVGMVDHCQRVKHEPFYSNSDPSLDEDIKKDVGYNSFLDEVGSYYYDEASGKVRSLSGEPPSHRINQSGHLLLKKYKAPVLFVRKITKELLLTLRSQLDREDILQWRRLVVEWYRDFRKKMKEYVLDVINKIR